MENGEWLTCSGYLVYPFANQMDIHSLEADKKKSTSEHNKNIMSPGTTYVYNFLSLQSGNA
jgi:hypothetical protein